jgi:hypothetical protein
MFVTETNSKYELHQSISEILSFVPEHRTYIEFSSSLSLLFSKTSSPIEVVNDTDSSIVTFFRVLRNNHDLETFCSLVFLMKSTWSRLLSDRIAWASKDAVAAAKWFLKASSYLKEVTNRPQTFGSWMSEAREQPVVVPPGLWQIVSHLMTAQIEHKTFSDLVKTYDHPGALFFLENPRISSSENARFITASLLSDADLVYLLLQIKGKVIFLGEGNPFFIYLERAGWERHELTGWSQDQPKTIWVRR